MSLNKIHIVVILFVLLGPIITLFFDRTENLNFTFYIFPVTINTIDLRISPDIYKEQRIPSMLFPILNIKILIFGILVLVNFIQNFNNYYLLKRFYIILLLVSVMRLIAYVAFITDNFSGLIFFAKLVWTVGLILILLKTYAQHRACAIEAEAVPHRYLY